MTEQAWAEIRRTLPQRLCVADFRAIEVRGNNGKISLRSLASISDMHSSRLASHAYHRKVSREPGFLTHWRWPERPPSSTEAKKEAVR